MDKAVFDIIDTTIKIGLGATIAGASTYLLSIQKHKQDKENDIRKETNNILKDIALKIESANNKLDEATHPFWNLVADRQKNIDSPVIKESITLLLESIKLIREARAYVALLEITYVKEQLTIAEELIQNIYQLIAKNLLRENEQQINSDLKIIQGTFSNAFNELAKLFNKT